MSSRDRDGAPDFEHAPVMVDEIQSCIWSPELFLFREFGLEPDFVSVGKGFPGGQYPASRILTTASPTVPSPALSCATMSLTFWRICCRFSR